jgi:GNAT superfamily N-acetyltransferase
MANHSITYEYSKVVTDNPSSTNSMKVQRITRTVLLKHGDDTIGKFVIEGLGRNNECFDTGNTCSMEINIDEEYQGHGYAKQMIRKMIENIKRDYKNIRDDQLLGIDGDGSDGFWDKIGMYEGRYGYDTLHESNRARNRETYGQEKITTIRGLIKFARSDSTRRGRSRSPRREGGRRNKRRTHRKRRTSRRT